MDVKIPYTTTADKKAAFAKAKSTINPEALLSKFGVKADLNYLDDKEQIVAKGKGFDLLVNFREDGVEISIDLAFLLKPFKAKIVGVLEKELRRVI